MYKKPIFFTAVYCDLKCNIRTTYMHIILIVDERVKESEIDAEYGCFEI